MRTTKIIETKDGKEWIKTFSEVNEAEVYRTLSRDLIAKKINKCTYIKSIKRIQTYNGYEKIIVLYDNQCRAIYTIVS